MEISSLNFDVTKLALCARLQERALKGTRNKLPKLNIAIHLGDKRAMLATSAA